MDSPLSTLGFVIFGITFSIYSVIVESPSPPTSASPPHSPPPPPPPPPRLPSSPHLSPPPPPLRSHAPAPLRPPFSPHNLSQAKPGPKFKTNRPHHKSPPSPTSHRMNGGKKVGLLFAGLAGIMQIGVVGFLVFKRRQLLRTKDAFEVGA